MKFFSCSTTSTDRGRVQHRWRCARDRPTQSWRWGL